jgi:hypothetical protein
LATLAGGIAWVTLLGMVADRTPANLGTSMVLSSSLLSLGGAVGIALSAGLLDISGYGAIALGMLTLAALAAGTGWVKPGEAAVPVVVRETGHAPVRNSHH